MTSYRHKINSRSEQRYDRDVIRPPQGLSSGLRRRLPRMRVAIKQPYNSPECEHRTHGSASNIRDCVQRTRTAARVPPSDRDSHVIIAATTDHTRRALPKHSSIHIAHLNDEARQCAGRERHAEKESLRPRRFQVALGAAFINQHATIIGRSIRFTIGL